MRRLHISAALVTSAIVPLAVAWLGMRGEIEAAKAAEAQQEQAAAIATQDAQILAAALNQKGGCK